MLNLFEMFKNVKRPLVLFGNLVRMEKEIGWKSSFYGFYLKYIFRRIDGLKTLLRIPFSRWTKVAEDI